MLGRSSASFCGLAALLTLTPGLTAQWGLHRLCPPRGQAFQLQGPPAVSFSLVRAADGTGQTRFLLSRATPGAKVSCRWFRGGFRVQLRATLQSPALGTFPIKAEVDAKGPTWDLSWDVTARITELPADLAVTALGLEFKFRDVAGDQAVLVPVFSGGEFVEPADSIPLGQPVDTNTSHSVQATAYYGSDGTGLLMYAKDPAGTKPKHFRYESGREGSVKTITFSLEYFLPNANVGGRPAETLAPIAIRPYFYFRSLGEGWLRAAKVYRRWIEKNGKGSGGMLERGRLEDRADVPKWMKEIDLLVSEQYGWPLGFQPNLLNLTRLKSDLGVDNMVVGLFFLGDPRVSPNGLTGSYYPDPLTQTYLPALRTLGIRSTGYTFPAAFDLGNPFLLSQGLDTEVAQRRDGTAIVEAGTSLVQMDLASPKLQAWYRQLGALHSGSFGLSGFFSDIPASAGFPDWRRPAGQDVGISELGYQGYKKVLLATIEGAKSVNQDFVQYHESAFEWLVPVANFGQGAVGVIGRAYKDETRTRGVPFFQAVYSGYTQFWPAEEGLGFQTLAFVPGAYGDLTKNAISRLLAEGFTWGGIPDHSELFLSIGKLYFEPPLVLPPELLAAILHHGNVLRNLIQLRREARPWLVYGEMLGSPAVDGDMVDVIVQRPFENAFFDQTYRKFAVPTMAYKAKDRSVRVVAANGGTTAASVVVDLARVGQPFARILEDVKTKERFTADRRSRRIRVPVAGGTGRLLKPVTRWRR